MSQLTTTTLSRDLAESKMAVPGEGHEDIRDGQPYEGAHGEVVLSNLASIPRQQIPLTSVATAQAGSAQGAA